MAGGWHGVVWGRLALLGTLVCLGGLSPSRAGAQTHGHSAFWREVRAPGFWRSRELLRQGRALAGMAAREHGASRNARLLGSIRRFRLARQLAPDDPEPLFELGRASAALEPPSVDAGEEASRRNQAQSWLTSLRERFPEYESARVAFELGVLAAHAQDFPRAAEEYQRALDAARVGEGAPSMHANLAEVLMLSGVLDRAEAEYREAIRLNGSRPGTGLALSLFGLAVCLDRMDEPAKALETVRRALVAGGGADVLRSEGVFFEPAAELSYYDALALRALAADADSAFERARFLRQAASALSRYLEGVAPETPFYELAAHRLHDVRAELETLARSDGSGRRRPRR